MMNDFDILNRISQTLGRATIKSKLPEIGKLHIVLIIKIKSLNFF